MQSSVDLFTEVLPLEGQMYTRRFWRVERPNHTSRSPGRQRRSPAPRPGRRRQSTRLRLPQNVASGFPALRSSKREGFTAQQ